MQLYLQKKKFILPKLYTDGMELNINYRFFTP